ncbi:hypothetical protein MNEG_2669, partial [Monoraphidium neglectum]
MVRTQQHGKIDRARQLQKPFKEVAGVAKDDAMLLGNPAARQKDKFVSLGVPGDEDAAASSSAAPLAPDGEPQQHLPRLPSGSEVVPPAMGPPAGLFEDLAEPLAKASALRGHVVVFHRGRIAVITVAESLDRRALEELLTAKFPRLQVKSYQEVLHATPSLGESSGDAFFFNYGTVVFWGISTADEQALMHTVVRPCSVGPLDVSEVEIDSFSYNYSAVEPPHVQ